MLRADVVEVDSALYNSLRPWIRASPTAEAVPLKACGQASVSPRTNHLARR
jgi:hypothetical protein